MSSIVNRSPFEVKIGNKSLGKLRSKKAAEELAATTPGAKVSQSETGSWEAVIRIVGTDGKTHEERRRFDTNKEATTWAEIEEEKLKALRKAGTPASAAKTPFEDAIDEWFKQVGSKLKGANIMRYNIKAVKEGLDAKLPIDSISVQVLREWRDSMREEGYAPSTVANQRQIISGTFKYWISEKDFPGINPARNVKWDKPDNVTEPPTLSDDEEKKIRKVIAKKSPWLVPIFEWALETAMRRSEILGLSWTDIDFEEKVVSIRAEKNDWKKGQTEALGRKIPLWPAAEKILVLLAPDKKNRKGIIFSGSPSSVTHSFALNFKESKVEKPGFTFHSLRKVATGRLAKKLPNVIELSKITGHRDLETLARRYYSVSLKELCEKISAS